MKQTAVEWIEDEFCSLDDGIKLTRKTTKKILYLFSQAKEMEKQHMIEAWDNGFANGYDLGKHDDQTNPDDAEQYYNETFKSE